MIRTMQRKLVGIFLGLMVAFAPLTWHGRGMVVSVSAAAAPNSWTPAAPISALATHPEVVPLLDGRILMLSGRGLGDQYSGALPSPQLYDPATGAWSSTATPPWAGVADSQFAVRLSDGRVLIGGGAVGTGPTEYTSRNTYIYDPSQPNGGTWTPAALMPTGLTAPGAALLQDGRAIVVCDDRIYAYSPGTDSWTQLTNLPYPFRNPLVLATSNNKVLAIGGTGEYSPGAFQSFYVYDVASNAWTLGPVTAGGYGRAAVLLANGRVLIAGGGNETSGPSTHAILYDPVTSTYTMTEMHVPRIGHALVRMSNGLVLAAGGRTPNVTLSAEVYDPATNAWYTAANLGDYHHGAGSAALPNGTVLVAGGGTLTSEIYTPGDLTPPIVSTPITTIRSGVAIGSTTVPARVIWVWSDAGGSGIKSFDVQRSYDGGAWTTVATGLTSAAYNVTLTVGHRYRYQVRGRDNAGHIGPWHAGATVKPAVTQNSSTSVKYSGTWSTTYSSVYLGGSARYASGAGASASYTFTGRSIAFVTSRGSNRGSARIYVDGALISTVNLYATTYTYRYLAFQQTWTTSATHTIKIVVVGTAGHPRIHLDAFALLRDP
jgi:hypothetical protein